MKRLHRMFDGASGSLIHPLRDPFPLIHSNNYTYHVLVFSKCWKNGLFAGFSLLVVNEGRDDRLDSALSRDGQRGAGFRLMERLYMAIQVLVFVALEWFNCVRWLEFWHEKVDKQKPLEFLVSSSG